MAILIKDESIASDNWQSLEGSARHWLTVGEDGFVPDLPERVDLIVPLALLKVRGREILQRTGRTGVVLEPHEDPAALAAMLGRLSLVAIRFPKFGDGRGYSIARLLRERYGYIGELRAVGDVLRDQLLFMKRSGFDSFDLRDDQDPDEALAAFRELSEQYQSSNTEPQPLFRRRYARAA